MRVDTTRDIGDFAEIFMCDGSKHTFVPSLPVDSHSTVYWIRGDHQEKLDWGMDWVMAFGGITTRETYPMGDGILIEISGADASGEAG